MTSTPKSPQIAVDLRALVGVPSGIGFYTLALLKHLDKQRAHYLGASHRPVAVVDELENAGIDLRVDRGPFGVWWQQRILPKVIEDSGSSLLWSPITTLPRQLRVPAVVTIHDLTTLLYPETHRLKVRLSVKPFLESTVRQARFIAVDSQATATDLDTFFPQAKQRVRVVYPGVDPEFVPGDENAVDQTRRELGCPEGFILYAGTIEPRKNLGALVTAWESLRSSTSATPPLVVVGAYGWRSRPLMERMEQLSSVGLKVLGRVDRPRLVKLMQASSVFVYPSLYEGFGLPPAEAMACGIPTIASSCSSLPEVVGDAGILIQPEDRAALASSLSRLLQNPTLAAELGEKGRERVNRFRWQKTAAEMEELFFQALDKPG